MVGLLRAAGDDPRASCATRTPRRSAASSSQPTSRAASTRSRGTTRCASRRSSGSSSAGDGLVDPETGSEGQRRRDRRGAAARLGAPRQGPRRRAAAARDRSPAARTTPTVQQAALIARSPSACATTGLEPRRRARRRRRPAAAGAPRFAPGAPPLRPGPVDLRRARRAGRRAGGLGALHPGPARHRQDLHRRPPRGRPDAPRPAGRRGGDLAQGDPQAARRDRGRRGRDRRSHFSGRQEVLRRQRREPLCAAPASRSSDNSPRARWPPTSELLAGTAWLWARRGHARGGRRAVHRRGRPGLARRRASRWRRARAASCCSATPSSSRTSARARTRAARAPRCCDTSSATHNTVPPDRGVLLERTWRMHPDVCEFVSRHDVRRPPAPDPGPASPRRSSRRGLARRRPAAARGDAHRQPPDRARGGRRDRRRVRPRLLDGGRWRDRDGDWHDADARRHPRRRALQRPGPLPARPSCPTAPASGRSTSSRASRRRSCSSR